MKTAWRTFDSAPWQDGWCIEAIAEHLQAIVDGELKRLIINIPPRCSKSALCSVALTAWTWCQQKVSHTSGPGVSFLYASFKDNLVTRDSRKCRQVIESKWYQSMWSQRFSLLNDQNAKSRFANSAGGERLTTSVEDKGATGEGANIIVCDDVNSARQVESEAVIETTLDWFDGTMRSRLNNQKLGAFIEIQQRVGENDITGHILSKNRGDWCHLCYDDQTEILTKNRGWIPVSLMALDDIVMGVDPMTLSGQWESPTKIIRAKYNGKMINYKSATADLCITPDHRMVYADMNDVYGDREIERWQVRAASELPKDFYLPQTIVWHGSRSPIMLGGREWKPEVYADFMGWYLAEGCASKKSRCTRIVQKIGSPGEALIDEMMSKVPFHVGKYNNSKTMRAWQIKDRFLATELALLGTSKIKRMPAQLKDLAPEFLRIMLISYARGDGHFAKRNPLKITISSGSPWMIGDLQECAVKAGWASSQNSYLDKSAGTFPNGIARKHVMQNRLYLRASKRPGRPRKIGSHIKEKNTSSIDYDGIVHCLSVPSTAVVVRRSGRVSISGNCLPMEYEPERAFMTPIGWIDPRTEPGELLWPERFGPEEVASLKEDMGEWRAAGQLQQRPEPRGGGIIKRDDWQLWANDAYPLFDYICATVDTAYTSKTANDQSAMIVWGIFSGGDTAQASRMIDRDGRTSWNERIYMEEAPKVMMMYAWTGHLDFQPLVDKIASVAKSMKVNTVLIENKASGISVSQEIRRLYSSASFGLQFFDPKSQDKFARLVSVQHLFQEKLIYAPNREWAEMVMTQTGQFPRGKRDDLVDCVSMGVTHLRETGLLTRATERRANMESLIAYPERVAPLYTC